jgi:two-component system, OmpR family, phosphate regulon sensor histidine kinase PhoR
MKAKSLTLRIFLSNFLVGALVYFACAFLFISNMYSYFEKQILCELESEAAFLEGYVLNGQLEELSKLNTKNRITLIHKDGSVYFDNTVDASTLENHAKREEIAGALTKGSYKSSRYSDTMLEKTLYFARQIENGDVLRISRNQHSVALLVLDMGQVIFVMLVIAVIISAIASNLISRQIVNPLNKINLENPEGCEVYEELKPFTKRIVEENFEKNQREQLRQQFSANVSHELKTPLTSISGFAEILKAGGTDEKTTVDFAKIIYDESQRMITLVNDIIKLSKLDESSIMQEKEEVSLREVTKQAFEILSVPAKAKNIQLNLFGDSGNILAVEPVIYEMIYNLVDNAIKYNKADGEVDVSIETSYSEEGGKPSAKKVVLRVKDTGIGIPNEDKERIFERFYRVDKSRSKNLGGTGLGLSIVKHGAKYHNAQVLLDTQEGKGSVFTLIFNV